MLFDLPQVIASLDVQHDRLTAQAGDFFADGLPSADAYVLMEVLHDDECVTILKAIRRAGAPWEVTRQRRARLASLRWCR